MQPITVLRSVGPVLAKRWTETEVIGCAPAKYFNVSTIDVDGVDTLYGLIKEMAADQYACIIRGQPRPGGESRHVRRTGENFEDRPSHLFMIDIDGYQGSLEQAVNGLPAPFQDVSHVWQLSGSYGHPLKHGLRAHLWFWLEKPLTCSQAESWARAFLPDADATVHRTVQINYTSDPVMLAGMTDPHATRRTGIHHGSRKTVVIPSEQLDVDVCRATLKRSDRLKFIDARNKPGVVGAFCRAFEPRQIAELCPTEFAEGSTPDRFTWLNGSGGLDGVTVTDSGTHLYSSHSTAPIQGAANMFDFVRLHLFGHLDDPGQKESYELDVTASPSYTAMLEWAKQLDEVRDELRTEPADHGRFQVHRAADLASANPLTWHIKGLLPRSELVSIYGASGSGKSFLILDIATAVAAGRSWRERATRQGRVVYIAAEGAGALGKRLEALRVGRNIDLAAIRLGIIKDAPNLLTEDYVRVAEQIIADGGADLIIVDTLAQTTPGGDENSSGDMGKALSACKALHQLTGATICLVAHTGKDESRGARGWSGLKAAVDAEIQVSRKDNISCAKITKMKDDNGEGIFPFRLKQVILMKDEDGDDVTSCVVEHLDEPEHGFDPVQPVKQRRPGTWQGALQDALSNFPSPRDVTEADLLSAALSAVAPPTNGKRDNRKQCLRRALDSRPDLKQWLKPSHSTQQTQQLQH